MTDERTRESRGEVISDPYSFSKFKKEANESTDKLVDFFSLLIQIDKKTNND